MPLQKNNHSYKVLLQCNRMSGVKARKWVVRSYFVGQPKREDLEIVEEELPPIKDGGQGVGGGEGCARRTRFMHIARRPARAAF